MADQRDAGARRVVAIVADEPVDRGLDRCDPDLVVVGRIAHADHAHAQLVVVAQAGAHHAFAFVQVKGFLTLRGLAVEPTTTMTRSAVREGLRR
jgi:hypothetical protein